MRNVLASWSSPSSSQLRLKLRRSGRNPIGLRPGSATRPLSIALQCRYKLLGRFGQLPYERHLFMHFKDPASTFAGKITRSGMLVRFHSTVLILGGDKTGEERFYERVIPQAEVIWERY